VVLTEAASGAYVVTPLLAAVAGAEHVIAVTRTTRYGTVEEISAQTLDLARRLGVESRIEIVTQRTRELAGQADIVTNSGHVRPINAELVSWLKPTAVVSLMYESWELRDEDVDVAACRQCGICVGGVNEQHPDADVFSYLALMAAKLLMEAGIGVYQSRILLVCDNPFGPFIVRGLRAMGATVEEQSQASRGERWDAILVALTPRSKAPEAGLIAARWPDAVVVQYVGDLDRTALRTAGVAFWPVEAPPAGHMGILPSAIGPEPIVNLQVGGLKAGEILWRARRSGADCQQAIEACTKSGYGLAV
jgi:hypothetical protein